MTPRTPVWYLNKEDTELFLEKLAQPPRKLPILMKYKKIHEKLITDEGENKI